MKQFSSFVILATIIVAMAMNMIKTQSAEQRYSEILSELLYDFTLRNRKADADSCYAFLKGLPKNNRFHNYYVGMIAYFNRYGPADSVATYARYYLNNTHEWNERRDAVMELCAYYSDKGNAEKASQYAHYLKICTDSIKKEMTQKQANNVLNTFKYHQDEKAEFALKEHAQQLRFTLMTVLAGCIILLCIFMIYFLYNKKRLLGKILNLNTETASLKKIVKEEKEKQIANEKRLKTLKDENEKINKHLEKEELELQMRMAQNAELMRIVMMEKANSNGDEIIMRFRNATEGKDTIEDKDWKILFAVVNRMYPGFEETIRQKMVKLSQTYTRICYLLKIGMTNIEIEKITGYAHQTVWRRVKQIRNWMSDDINSTFR